MSTTDLRSLHQLSKVELLPTRSSELSATLSFLEKIDHIEINGTTERNGVVYYRVEVFLQHSMSRIPTVKATAVADHPDYQLERRFSDFANLRYQVWMYAQRKHEDDQSCEYCGEFMSYIVHSLSQPRSLVKLVTGVNARKKLLVAFCNTFIEKTIAGKTDLQMRNSKCTGLQTIPHIVEDFFRPASEIRT
ncbi:hypothetical protein PHYSODRAFT_315355 [Phytophthora sojae]|uniref:PX domain-containing protein n=1 Tax=Phytophthora sojae (strain P6497) TaxID=1094619 RepID=G4ZIY7_PHYSP|nr:hypothetical protein PHYSODRAFT_315355 [Phytophthora sojae]EGZ18792.1 hypothetical protein PHYSODRAFT_315355 [Phytophthora sojae]|eukprot:XP_009527850.1 hypothetical protein PHYSODRAFT_315355 [Phytophthora sojae]